MSNIIIINKIVNLHIVSIGAIFISLLLLSTFIASQGLITVQVAKAAQVNRNSDNDNVSTSVSGSSTNSIITNQNTSIGVKKVRVGDIDVAYRMFGKGDPLLLIAGAGATMDSWDPTVLRQLSENHTVIIFDNRGIGKTPSGSLTHLTISQYANDTAGLIDALHITKPVDVLGHSLGSFIAQELALTHPQKVNKLIFFASNCGTKEAIPGSPEAAADFAKLASPNLTSMQQVQIIADLLFPAKWKKEHPNYVSYLPKSIYNEYITPQTVRRQGEAVATWKGSCNRLAGINKPTLILVGTDDNVTPPANSLMLAEKIPAAWLVQINGGGHGLIYQYPDKFSKIVITFLGI